MVFSRGCCGCSSEWDRMSGVRNLKLSTIRFNEKRRHDTCTKDTANALNIITWMCSKYSPRETLNILLRAHALSSSNRRHTCIDQTPVISSVSDEKKKLIPKWQLRTQQKWQRVEASDAFWNYCSGEHLLILIQWMADIFTAQKCDMKIVTLKMEKRFITFSRSLQR